MTATGQHTTPLHSFWLTATALLIIMATCVAIGHWLDRRRAADMAALREHITAALGGCGSDLGPIMTGGLDGYTRGYVDGLARQPMANEGKIVPITRERQ